MITPSQPNSASFGNSTNSEIPPEQATHQALRMFYQLFKDDPRRSRVQLFEILGVSPSAGNDVAVDGRPAAAVPGK